MKTRHTLVSFALGLSLAVALLQVLGGMRLPTAHATMLDHPVKRPLPQESNVLTVCLPAAGTCPYTSVQAAVDAAGPGDVIKVAAGTYTQVHRLEPPPVDLVLLLDTSESMAYDTCDPLLAEPGFFNCLEACVASHSCQPFDGTPSVRWAAHAFVNTFMRDGIDRVAAYRFDKAPVNGMSVESYTCMLPPSLSFPVTLTQSSGQVISLTTTKQDVLDAIDDPGLNVYVRPPACNAATGECCEKPIHVGGYWGEYGGSMQECYGYRWASTNVGGGLREAVDELNNKGIADTSAIILLSDGAANATDIAADSNAWWTCPSPSGSGGPDYRNRCNGPFCRDQLDDTRHCSSVANCTNPTFCDNPLDPNTCLYTNWGETLTDTIMWNYDADDYARDIADAAAAQQIPIYTIGFGPSIAGSGEHLLRYIADATDDGDPETAPCGSDFYWDDEVVDPIPAPGENCGNYFFATDAAHLEAVFETLASQIINSNHTMTRIVHITKTLTLQGGYTTTNWNQSFPFTQRIFSVFRGSPGSC